MTARRVACGQASSRLSVRTRLCHCVPHDDRRVAISRASEPCTRYQCIVESASPDVLPIGARTFKTTRRRADGSASPTAAYWAEDGAEDAATNLRLATSRVIALTNWVRW